MTSCQAADTGGGVRSTGAAAASAAAQLLQLRFHIERGRHFPLTFHESIC